MRRDARKVGLQTSARVPGQPEGHTGLVRPSTSCPTAGNGATVAMALLSERPALQLDFALHFAA